MRRTRTSQSMSVMRSALLAVATTGALMVPGHPRAFLKLASPRRYLDAARLARRYVAWLDGLSAAARHTELRRFHIRPFEEQTRRIALAG